MNEISNKNITNIQLIKNNNNININNKDNDNKNNIPLSNNLNIYIDTNSNKEKDNEQKLIKSNNNNNNNKEYLIEHYVDDPEIIKEFKELFNPIKKRLKFTFYYNIAICFLSVLYAKNLGFYITKYLPKINKGLFNLVLFSSCHAFFFSGLLIGGNLAILGINPRKFMSKYKELDEKIMSKDPYRDLSLKGFIDGVSNGFSIHGEKKN
jgi:hypothetical protein